MRAEAIIACAEKEAADIFQNIDETEFENQKRVVAAFSNNRVSTRHFAPTYGYGYSDIGRDTFESVFAEAMFCEAAIARLHILSGTHAIYMALDGLLNSNDTIVFATGVPYDTLKTAIEHERSFKSRGVNCVTVDLLENGNIDVECVLHAVKSTNARIVYVQRSRGYSWRNSILPGEMEGLFSAVRNISQDIITFVDNCYGEFVCDVEPTCFGADIIAGSMIKNPGGGFAPTGGYIAGKEKLIEQLEHRLTAPAIGREIGSYAGSYLPLYQGLFMAPHATAQALKTAVLFSKAFELMNLETSPKSDSIRSDIVQAVKFKDEKSLVRFCQVVQSVSPIDAFAIPEPSDMPGYEHKVIMAAGTFVQGATIELSADGPIRPPYTAYIQGALTYSHGKYAALKCVESLLEG